MAFILFLLALYEEKKDGYSDESIHLVIIYLFVCFFFCVFSGVSVMNATIAYINTAGDLVIYYDTSYQAFGWVGITLGCVPLIMGIQKVLEYLGSRSEV